MPEGVCGNRMCRALVVIGAVYTLLVAVSLVWSFNDERRAGLDVARITAQAYLDKDHAFRHWITSVGGVYVPVSEQVEPSPYLAQVPERDVETQSGRRLTLMNSAYVSRQMNEQFPGTMGAYTHVTSLDPLRPENAPDPWERRALEALEGGVPEVSEVVVRDGEPHLRLMAPFVTKEGCLKCHAGQGYQVGDILGGTSIALPLTPFTQASTEHKQTLVLSHGAFWAAGIGALVLFYLGDRRWARAHAVQEDRLRESEARFRGLVSNLPGAVYRCEAEEPFSISYISEGIRDISGQSGAALAAEGRGFSELVHPDDLTKVRREVERALARRQPFALDYRLVGADGRVRWVHDQGQGVFDGSAGPLWLDGVVFDQSARREAEAALDRANEFQARILAAAGEGILGLDREGHVTLANDAACAMLGFPREDLVGRIGHEVWHHSHPDGRPRSADECLLCRSRERGEVHRSRDEVFWRRDGTRFPVEYVSTPIIEEGRVTGAVVVFSDISERFAAIQHRRRVLVQTISALSSLVETRDPFIAGHQDRVAQVGVAIARKLGFPESQQEGVRIGGQLHDIGKVYVPSEILSRPGRLNAQELSIVQSHVEAGHDIIRQVEFDWPVADMVLQHHERMDGSGYPQGLSGAAIREEARILAVADVVEAMTSHRPYRTALSLDAALEEITLGRGTRYDAPVVDACVALFREDGFTFQ